jgi:N-acetylmuramoyl-L-alanine amidase
LVIDEKGILRVKKLVLVLISVSLLAATSLYGQKKADVLLKFSQQDKDMRIVFEAAAPFIAMTKVFVGTNHIQIDFPEPFNLPNQKALPFQMITADKSLTIRLKEKSEVKSFVLSAPARLVLDIHEKDMGEEKQPEKQSAQQVFPPSIVIDPGHGGFDFGITHGNMSEKEISLSLARELSSALSRKGRKVFLTRRVDQYSSLSERIVFVNQKKPDAFISIHLSASGIFSVYRSVEREEGSIGTYESFALSSRQRKYAAKSSELSESIRKSLGNEFKTDIKLRELPLPLLDSVSAPAVLIELPSPQFTGYDQQMKTRLVNAIVNGITAYGQ